MNYRVQFFANTLFVDVFDENGDFAGTYLSVKLPEGETAKKKMIDAFRYIANRKDMGF